MKFLSPVPVLPFFSGVHSNLAFSPTIPLKITLTKVAKWPLHCLRQWSITSLILSDLLATFDTADYSLPWEHRLVSWFPFSLLAAPSGPLHWLFLIFLFFRVGHSSFQSLALLTIHTDFLGDSFRPMALSTIYTDTLKTPRCVSPAQTSVLNYRLTCLAESWFLHSDKHPKHNICKTKLLIICPELALATPSSRCLCQPSVLSHPPIYYFSNSCWFYLQNRCRIELFFPPYLLPPCAKLLSTPPWILALGTLADLLAAGLTRHRLFPT